MLRSSPIRLALQQQRRRLDGSRSRRISAAMGAVADFGTSAVEDNRHPTAQNTRPLSSSRPVLSSSRLGWSRSQQRLHSSFCLAEPGAPRTGPTYHLDHHQQSCLVSKSYHHLQQQRHKSVFVSRHNQSLPVTPKLIIEHCENVKLVRSSQDYRTTATHVILKECPFCRKPTHDKPDNLYKLYLHSTTGAYFCHRCGAGGSWFDWKLKLSPSNTLGQMVDPSGFNYNPSLCSTKTGNTSSSSSSSSSATAPRASGGQSSYHSKTRDGNSNRYHSSEKTAPLPMPATRLQALYIEQLLQQQEKQQLGGHNSKNDVLQYLTQTRGLESAVLKKYGVGRAKYKFASTDNQWVESECVTFPWIMSVTDIQYQEQLRGAKFQWTEHSSSEGSDNDSDREQQSADKSKESAFLLRRIKVRSIEKKSWQRMDPPGGGFGLFGYHTVPEDATEIVVTEGEYDAMAVWQATGRPAVSLPNGCRSLPVEVLPLLERFEKIYLWMDNDAPGQEGAEQFARKLGLERTFLVRPTLHNCKFAPNRNTASNARQNSLNDNDDFVLQDDKEAHLLDDEGMDDDDHDEEEPAPDDTPPPVPKDANDALLAGLDLDAIIADAKRTPHERITTFRDLRDDVLHEIMHPDKYVGSPISSLPGLTSIIKGLRRGELTVLTGPTGSGKTTYLGQMSLDLVEQDVNVLWGSFEIKNTRLMHKLLQQFARQPLPAGDPSMEGELNALADRFEKLPFTFMKFHGGSDVDDVRL